MCSFEKYELNLVSPYLIFICRCEVTAPLLLVLTFTCMPCILASAVWGFWELKVSQSHIQVVYVIVFIIIIFCNEFCKFFAPRGRCVTINIFTTWWIMPHCTFPWSQHILQVQWKGLFWIGCGCRRRPVNCVLSPFDAGWSDCKSPQQDRK